MKFSMRKLSIKKALKPEPQEAQRAIKKPLYLAMVKKGTGWLRDPKKAAYNKIYKKTSFSIFDLFK